MLIINSVGANKFSGSKPDHENKTAVSRATSTISGLEEELVQLQDRYEDLLDIKAERYKARLCVVEGERRAIRRRYADGREFRKGNKKGMNEEQNKRRLEKRLVMKKRVLMEIEEDGRSYTFSVPQATASWQDREQGEPNSPTTHVRTPAIDN
ncbi:hypothetical protein C0989_010482 [Termitomyces sp. Mn162]|nr:hypothetical protein C0989_010482 [Termitomyces sp. Mn162]KAH0581570.1 hypothetical protein H2248_011277 [Termitomyces sp. 'cryptogamus']